MRKMKNFLDFFVEKAVGFLCICYENNFHKIKILTIIIFVI